MDKAPQRIQHTQLTLHLKVHPSTHMSLLHNLKMLCISNNNHSFPVLTMNKYNSVHNSLPNNVLPHKHRQLGNPGISHLLWQILTLLLCIYFQLQRPQCTVHQNPDLEISQWSRSKEQQKTGCCTHI